MTGSGVDQSWADLSASTRRPPETAGPTSWPRFPPERLVRRHVFDRTESNLEHGYTSAPSTAKRRDPSRYCAATTCTIRVWWRRPSDSRPWPCCQLDTACANAEDLAAAATERFVEHPDAAIITSVPGLAELTGARILARHQRRPRPVRRRPRAQGLRRQRSPGPAGSPLRCCTGGSRTSAWPRLATSGVPRADRLTRHPRPL